MWYFKVMLWLWHIMSILGLFFDKGRKVEIAVWMILIVLTIGFLGIIKALVGENDSQNQTSEVSTYKEG